MIIDRLEDRCSCFTGPAWDLAFEFLNDVNANSEERRYALRGEEVYAMVSSYSTRQESQGFVFEAHRKYIDIQMALVGSERILWEPISRLTVKDPYSAEKDAELFHPLKDAPAGADLTMTPGVFAVFFPRDGHAPGLALNGVPATIKKVVVKIKLDHVCHV